MSKDEYLLVTFKTEEGNIVREMKKGERIKLKNGTFVTLGVSDVSNFGKYIKVEPLIKSEQKKSKILKLFNKKS